ncbi:TetR-like C-terminal domain-containing protein, partial [Streptomyces carpinensis]
LLRTFTESRRADLRRILQRGRDRGELPADRDVELLIDQFYGFFWYRFLLGHGPLDTPTAERITDSLLGWAGAAEGPQESSTAATASISTS